MVAKMSVPERQQNVYSAIPWVVSYRCPIYSPSHCWLLHTCKNRSIAQEATSLAHLHCDNSENCVPCMSPALWRQVPCSAPLLTLCACGLATFGSQLMSPQKGTVPQAPAAGKNQCLQEDPGWEFLAGSSNFSLSFLFLLSEQGILQDGCLWAMLSTQCAPAA